MRNKDNILKWLNDEMSAEELKNFKQTEDYRNYADISNAANYLNLPSLNTDTALNDLRQRLATQTKSKVIPLYSQFIFKVAASFIILFGLGTYFTMSTSDTTLSTQIAENKTYTLKDNSVIQLNAGSTIAYKEDGFLENRELNLDGEAFFDVTKKGKFTVQTAHGDIRVLGTSFNIKSRKNDFNVFCFTGKVQVTVKNEVFTLTKGEGVRINKNNQPSRYVDETLKSPNWMNNESVFYEVPYKEVIEEFQRQYNIKIQLNTNINDDIFTGAFDNNDMDSAIKSITLPLNLNYQIKDDIIEIYN